MGSALVLWGFRALPGRALKLNNNKAKQKEFKSSPQQELDHELGLVTFSPKLFLRLLLCDLEKQTTEVAAQPSDPAVHVLITEGSEHLP